MYFYSFDCDAVCLLAFRLKTEQGRERYPAALRFEHKRCYKSTNAMLWYHNHTSPSITFLVKLCFLCEA